MSEFLVRQPHCLLLTRLVAGVEQLQIGAERALLDHLVVTALLKRCAKQDVVLDAVVLEPGYLACICQAIIETRLIVKSHSRNRLGNLDFSRDAINF